MEKPDQRRAFLEAEDGQTLVFVGVSLALLLGLVSLSFDLGRASITQSDLSSYADNVALAAAAELDGKADAITRATAAAEGMISDTQTFGTGDTQLAGAVDFDLTFLASLPASDTATPTDLTTDPEDARFAWVIANDVTVETDFARAFRGLRGNAHQESTVSAEAVAGMTQMACDIAPLMFCVPSGWEAEDNIGTMINLRSGGQGAAWGPGDFGFLRPDTSLVDPAGPCAGLNGAQLYRCLVGATGNIAGCVSQNGVNIEPGQREGVTTPALNTRFDIYTGAMQGKRTDPHYSPASNVVKALWRGAGGGGGANQCIQNNGEPTTNTMALPRDTCLQGACGRFGDGTWSRASYINTNHGGTDPVTGPVPGAAPGSRWELYLAEIAKANAAGPAAPILTPGLQETGRPVCSTQPPAGPQRRLLVSAGIDCDTNPINGAATDVPVDQFVVVFMTEPATNYGATTPPTLDIFVEVVDVAGDGGGGASGFGGIFRDVVQLYR